MSSLTSCLKKAGDAIRAEDKAAVLSKSREYRANGMTANDAGKKAIAEQLDAVRALIKAEQEIAVPKAAEQDQAPPEPQSSRPSFGLEIDSPEAMRQREQDAKDAQAEIAAKNRAAAAIAGGQKRKLNNAEEKARADAIRKERADAAVANFALGDKPPESKVSTDEAAGQKDVFGAVEDAAPVAESKADRDKESGQGGMFARGAQTAPQFYSQLKRAIDQVPERLASMPAQQWKLWLDSNGPKLGVKKDEIEWSGIKDYLDLRGKDKVTRDELAAYLADSGVRVTETVLGGAFGSAERIELERLSDIPRRDRTQAESTRLSELQNVANQEDSVGRGTKYAEYTQPGGENYREVLITLPVKQNQRWAVLDKNGRGHSNFDNEIEAQAEADDIGGTIKAYTPAGIPDSKNYKSSHWDQPNVVVHIRVNDRIDANGKRVFFVEEIQSDWGQDGKKKGFKGKTQEDAKQFFGISDADWAKTSAEDREAYRDEMVNTSGRGVIPAGPFVTKTESWLNLALKRVMMMAVEGGYDKVAFTDAEPHFKRWGTERIDWAKQPDGSYLVRAKSQEGGDAAGIDLEAEALARGMSKTNSKIVWTVEELEKTIEPALTEGQNAADLAPKIWSRMQSEDVGTAMPRREGFEAFYGDKNGMNPKTGQPSFLLLSMNALLKKLGGGKMESVKIPTDDLRMGELEKLAASGRLDDSGNLVQPGITITDAMRKTVGQGLPLFARDRPAEAPTTPANRLQMPVSDVQKAIDQIAAKWTNGPKTVVVNMPSDLPRPAPSDARGLLYGDTAYIVASNHTNRAGVQRTLAHEAIGHYGLWEMLGPDGTRKFQKNLQLALKSGNKPLNELSQKVRKLYVDKNGKFNLSPEDEANEIAAFAVEAALDADGNFKPGFGFMKEVYAKIAQFLRDLGINIQFTNLELQGMLVAATRGMEAGKRLDGGQGVVNAYARAWHGTPHRFDKFTTDKMGTGEGAQAYGWGLYFASKKEIAEHYRKNLQTTTRGGLFYKGNPLTVSTMNKLALNGSPAEQSVFSAKWPSKNIETEMEKRALQYEADAIEKAKQNSAISKEWAAEYTRRAAAIRSVMADIERRADRENGQLYEVEIPEDSEMLLWDKPLSEQPEAVRRALADADAEWAKQISGKKVPDFVSAFWPGNGSELYKQLSNRLSRYKKADFGDPKADRFASEYLASLGIKGIKYLDGTSRSAGEGSYNYVIFSGDDVEIQKTYYARGKFKGWPKSSNWTRQEYNDVVSLLPSAYRNDPHRREPLPANYRDSLPAGALQELASYGSIFSLDDLGNIQVDGQTAIKEDYANAKAMADKYGLGVFATNVKRAAMQQLHDDGFVGEMGMAMVLMRETGSSRAPMATPSENRYTKDAYSFGTMMAYKPRGFSPPTMFARGADDAMANQGGIPAGDGSPGADKYQMAGPIVDGREVRDDVPNMSSIASSLDDYTVLKGVREVPMSDFALTGKSYSVSETKRIENLAEQIKESGEINPMIVVIDKNGPYILEGAHRSEALFKLGAKSFPAVVVLDNESLNKSAAPDNGGAFARGNTKQTEAPAFIDVDGKQRPTTNNLGQAIHPTEDGIRNFWRGFDDSKAVDTGGRPLVVYHGTVKSFDEFNPEAEPYSYESDRGKQFFLDNPQGASDYAMGTSDAYGGNANVMPVYLRMENPRIEDVDGSPSEWWDNNVDDLFWKLDVEGAGRDGLIVRGDGETMYVTANPTQIKSATGNNGDFSPSNPNIAFARGGDQSIGNAIQAITVTNLKTKAGNKLADYRNLGLQFLGGRQINDLYAKDLPQLPDYTRMVQQMSADANEVGANADAVATSWGKLKDERQLAELMHDATLAQIDPAKNYVIGDSYLQWEKLKNQYEKLSEEAKKVYADARDGYKEHYAQIREAIRDKIERSDMAKPAKTEMLKRMDGEFFEKIKGVYFPLARFGKYVVVTRKGVNVVSVSRAETLNEAEALRASMRKQFPADRGYSVGKVTKDKEFNAARDSVGRGFLKDLFDVLDNEGIGDQLQDAVNQLYLASMPDLSWAKHGIHRKGTPGFSQDARRAYAQNMFHGARYLAKLRYADQLQAKLTDMQDHVDAQIDNDEFDSVKAQQVVDELTKRNDSLMNPKSNPLSTALTSFGFVFHLGLSPASAMVNLSQTALVAYPIMGAKWGFDKAAAALTVASAQATANKNNISSALNPDERRAYDEAVRSGTIDVTNAHDLAGIAQGEDQGVMWKTRPVMKWASFMFHHAERFNRQVTFVASYRLARAAGATHEAAFEQATKATYDGHFDYAASNRPRIMQGNAAKVILLFKQFAQNMIYTLARQAQLSVKAETPAGKKEARRALGGILVLHALAAGSLGLPVVDTLLTVASMLGSDDDEPWDAETALRNMLADTFGQKPAEVMARGLSRLTPFDISGRVSLNHLIFPDIQEGLEGQRLAESAMTAALGPVAGIGVNMFKGMQEISEGRIARGLESMMPVALRNPMKAYRYETEGNIDKTGVVINEKVSTAGVWGQAFGFSPSEVRNAQEARSAIYQADSALNRRRSALMNQFAMASMAGDEDGKKEVRQDIDAFNAKNPDRKITPIQLIKSVRSRKQRIKDAENGVYLPKKRRDAMEAGRFGAEDNAVKP